MGSVFKKQTTRPLPAVAEVTTKGGVRVARWRARGKLKTASVNSDGTRIITESGTYFAKFRGHDGVVVTRTTGCRDRQAAEQVLSRWEREVEQVKAGTLDPQELAVARKAAGRFEDHVADYERSLVANGVTVTHRKNVLQALRAVGVDCHFATLADIKRGLIERWLADKFEVNMSARSRNRYRDALVTFCNWCRDDGRLKSHDLGKLPKAEERSDPRRKRRAFSETELAKLLEVAASRPIVEAQTVRRGKNRGAAAIALSAERVKRLTRDGRERALIYKTLFYTGLRVNELRTLQVLGVRLDSGNESVHLDAANEKNRQGSVIPLRADLAAEIKDWLDDTGRNGRDLVINVSGGLRMIFDRDLKAAGIPKRDDRGRTLDVHALRTTLGTIDPIHDSVRLVGCRDQSSSPEPPR